MSMIKIENLSFTYPGSYDPIFENVNFQLDTDWKLGFIGRNGRGKTTFFNLLLKKYPYEGKIHSSVNFDYFPYEVKDKTMMTENILKEASDFAESWEIMKELSYLDVDPEVLWRPFNTLSNGEQVKVLLAALFLKKGNFLLIDEPTNHLDSGGRTILAAYLKRKKGFILISHDRAFLDQCVDHIVSINRAGIEVQAGNFSSWFTNFERQQQFEMGQSERLKKDVSRLEKAAGRTARWSDKVEASKIGATDKGFVGHKSAKMMKRSKTVEARRNKAVKEKSELLKNFERTDNLKLLPLQYRADRIATFENIKIMYDQRQVCDDISFDINRGERILLKGNNGSGKSSLLKLLLGDEIKHEGNLSIGSGLIISYVSQSTDHLEGYLTDYAQKIDIDESKFKTILRKMDFERVQFEKDMADFSDGQKKKVLIATSLCQSAHLYVWDEPLNFIDVFTRMQIEALLEEFSPTMIFVEHDSAFQQAIATKTIEL